MLSWVGAIEIWPTDSREITSAVRMSTLHAVVVTASDRPGMMSAVTKVLADHNANIRYVDLHSAGDRADIYFEFTIEEPPDTLLQDLKSLDGVLALEEIPSFAKIYGKRIIVMGGGAQVGQVALGAIAEADRHNIRAEAKKTKS